MQPSEFWALSPQEWWWEFDTKIVEQRNLERSKTGLGKFSAHAWAEARRKHLEKNKNGSV